ncbi:FxDxF family PEP-CTERM protein [Herbaspirillum sp. alder98]|uniref:FxDxF family PEP-CTERM protein n=1 Tax=Herbaspirillum sp. alder98 TaxID=2913096 RepID=UPI001CD8E71E|nr:FxDxF family PEP-CTERM protein [Herbaspirillum sp. alder98]MCA1325069.1 FxDxF family PEP-CTERM protein [Herbaspirillum sp. alder98]
MKKAISALFVSASLLCSAASYAATDLNNTSAITFTNNLTSSLGASFGAGTSTKTFTESFTFTQGSLFTLTSAVISITLSSLSGLDITSFSLSGNGVTSTGTLTSSAGLQTWTLSASNLSSGLYTLSAIGSITGTGGGSFGGNLSVAAVPEASTTAMMLGGLALVGFAATRRRRKQGADTRPTGLMPA